jgi:hypothetical protein
MLPSFSRIKRAILREDTTKKDIGQLIHATNPYDGFDPGKLGYQTPDLQGWGSEDPQFEKLIAQLRPQMILEVGTWKGASAIHMAKILKKLGLHSARIVCVDTWLGALEFWTNHKDPDRYQSLRLKNGYPSVYYTFLANVVLSHQQDVIIPFAAPSSLAARFFRMHGIQFPLVYIDGSHEYEDVYNDLVGFWPCVSSGGALFGDDFTPRWPGVIRAVAEFSDKLGAPYTHRGSIWVFKKTASVLSS